MMNNGFVKKKRELLLLIVAAFAIAISWRIGTLAVRAARAADVSDFERISPFTPKSLWLVRQARAIIETYQVDAESKSVTEDQLVHGAIKGMIESWKDPYTRFVSPTQLRDDEIHEGRPP